MLRLATGERGGDFQPATRAAMALRKELRIAGVRRRAAREFAALRGRTGLRVHLGSGLDLRPGWVNIDLALYNGNVPTTVPPQAIFVNHDLRAGIPLETGCADLVYSSHFFEHLEYVEAVRLIRDSYRILRPGGVFRLSIPDFRRCFEAYVRGDAEFFAPLAGHPLIDGLEPGTATLVDFLNYAVYQSGEHRWIADEEKLVSLLRRVGFMRAERMEYEEGLDPGSELRRRFSLYVQASK
jgi:predicted SAM-dependent methyltransferase